MKRYSFLLLVMCFTSSCKMYYLTSQQLKEQLQAIDSSKIFEAYDFSLGAIGVALKGTKNFYNGIEKVKVMDKDGKPAEITVTSRTAVRMHDTKGRHLQLYFDSMYLKDSLVYGSKSHFITLRVKPINIDSLVKIEIQ